MSEQAVEVMEVPALPASVKMPTLPGDILVGGKRCLDYANALTVTSPGEYEAADEHMADCKNRIKTWEGQRESAVGELTKFVGNINAFFRGPRRMLEQSLEITEAKMVTYRAEQRRLHEEAQRKAEEAARKQREELERKAREEQAKADAEVARRREEEDRQRKEREDAEARLRAAAEAEIEARRRGDKEAQEKARQAQLDEEKRRDDAQKAERAAREQAEKTESAAQVKVNAALDQAAAVRASPVAPMVAQKGAHSYSKMRWVATVTDKLALVKAVANGEAPLVLLDINQGALDDTADALQGQVKWSGVRCSQVEKLRARPKR